MSKDAGLRPRGFGGIIDCWQELLPAGGRVLRLPLEGIRDGPFLRLPGGHLYEVILVESLAESLGRLEGFVQEAAGRLVSHGALMVDMENLAAPRSVRFALEGRPGGMDPAGSIREPERRVHKGRVLAALAAAGLLLEEVYEVPSRPEEIGPAFLGSMLREGFLALSYAAGPPPARLWIVARKQPARQGTVLVGSGSTRQQQRTARCLESFLPGGWELLLCDGEADRETRAFNRGVARSRGELVWFLRAGTTADRTLFENLLARAVISPAAPARQDGCGLLAPGDLSGLMVQRTALFQTGPVPGEWRSDQVAYEDWCLRLEAITCEVHGVSGGYDHVAPEPADATTLTGESEQLLGRWAAVGNDGANDGAPAGAVHAAPWKGQRPRVSLCMIVRDEEAFLDGCLRSAAPCVDEMVIVDTGSTDRTTQIARSHGAQLLHFEWRDDFSAARNAALERATGDWVLSLDADEVLAPETPARIRALVEDPGVAGYHLRFRNHYTGGKSLGVLMVRLFRNLPGIRWVNRIHEQITPSLAQAAAARGLVLSVSDAQVDHHGYREDVMQGRQKNGRNDRLFRLHLQEHPDDVYMLYKYGDFLRRHTDRWTEARGCLRQAFDLITRRPPSAPREIPYASEIAALLVLECMREGRHAEAEEILDQALRRFMPTPNLHYLAASLALAREDSDEAIHHYQRCLAYRDQVLVVPIQEGITSHVALTGMAQAWMQKGDRERARHLLLQSQRIEPGHEVTAMTLSRLRLEEGDVSGSLTALTDHMRTNPGSASVCRQAGLILGQLGMDRQAGGMHEHAARLAALNQ